MILITGADQFLGYSIAAHFAQFEHLRPKIRLLCQNTLRCHGFMKAGIDVRQVDYCHPHHISLSLRGVDHVVLAIGNEKDRVMYAKRICSIAYKSAVQSIVCISHVGAVSTIHQSLQEYTQIEEEVMNSNCNWTILRLDFIQQYFHLWATYIEKYRQMLLPLTEDTDICPIHISDVCKVIESLLVDPQGHRPLPTLDEKHSQQVYTLTGPEPINGKHFVELLSSATGYTKFKFCHARPTDVQYYLDGLANDIWFDQRIKQEMTQLYKDGFGNYNEKAYSVPSPKQIQTYLDYFDWVQKTSSSVCVSHASMITSMPCKPMQAFFEQNANQFKPRV